ncbi:TIGR02206 family membrane protein [Bacillus sp. HMF5848]|uniref:YwaF family protein n=1 Tax=Bacillus sp. HMF5848 TaxID=2495421 RepID=UPI000F7663FA|nr:TIGR02206 family membrane protein [Bacillus sp. HMF5848]RSK26057.1 TIGR02206 family membrane protein [Bacillus sp. HMF5848]
MLSLFFSSEPSVPFTLMSFSHLVVLVIFVLVAFAMYVFRNNLKHSKWLPWSLLTILVISEVSYQIWSLSVGVWTPQKYIPIQLCSLSTFVGVYMLIKPSQRMFNFFYFIGFIAPLLAIITPDLTFGFPHYRFIKFFLHHMTIAWTLLYFVFVKGYRPTFKSAFTSWVALNVYAIPVFIINKLINANYMFLSKSAEAKTPLDWLGSGYWYIINLELLALSLFILVYAPVALSKRKKKVIQQGVVY